ncbi:MAG: tetratricopeptide repeat protein [Herminiimonas sp.]|nr:tetratricopeptide repeat protein [Herminiimonas sp.]
MAADDSRAATQKRVGPVDAGRERPGKRPRPSPVPGAASSGSHTAATFRPAQRPAPLLKQEPAHLAQVAQAAQARATHHAWLAQLTPQQMEEAARALRGKSSAGANCVSLAHGMLEFFKTRKPPLPANEAPNMMDDFSVLVTLDRQPSAVKQEPQAEPGDARSSSVGEHMAQSQITDGGLQEAHIPADVFYSIARNNMEEILDTPGIDLSSYRQPTMQFDQAGDKLRALAVQCNQAAPDRAAPATYGMVNLGKADSNIGHQLVYFARPDGVWFIDCQRISNGQSQAVQTALERLSDFNDDPTRQDAFQTRVFITPVYPFSSAALLGDLRSTPAANAPTPLPATTVQVWALGDAFFRENRPDEALTAYDNVVRLAPADPLAHLMRSTALSRMGRNEEAMAASAEAVRLDPNNPRTQLQHGTLLLKLNQPGAALRSFDQALALQPDHVYALAKRVVILSRLGRFPEAVLAADRCVELLPDDASVHYEKGGALFRLGRFEDALAALRRSTDLRGSLTGSWVGQAAALLGLGQHEQALAAIDRAVMLAPNNPAVHRRKACILSLLATAERDQATALQRQVMVHRGRANALQEQAMDARAQAHRLTPPPPPVNPHRQTSTMFKSLTDTSAR